MLALLSHEKQSCHGCGGFLPHTTDADTSWDASDPMRCYRCDALQRKQENYSDPKKTTYANALTVWPVSKRG